MNRFWSVVAKITGALCVAGGGVVTIGLLTTILLTQATSWGLGILLTLLVFFGLLPLGLGGLFLYASTKAHRKAIRERFFRLLQLNRGRVSVRDFASATQMEPAIARQHLDIWAREFHADFEVSDGGEIYYVFDTEPMALPGGEAPIELIIRGVKAWVNRAI
jgi:hypothetical protein